MNSDGAKQIIVAGVSISTIVASLGWIYFTQFASRGPDLALHRGVGEVMAEETDKLLEHKGKVIVMAVLVWNDCTVQPASEDEVVNVQSIFQLVYPS